MRPADRSRTPTRSRPRASPPRSRISCAAAGRLLDDGLLTEATYALALGREYFPRSAAIQTGQGRLEELQGDTDDVLAAYRRALELDPDDAVAKESIEQLGDVPAQE